MRSYHSDSFAAAVLDASRTPSKVPCWHRLPIVINDHDMEVGGRGEKTLGFQWGLYGAGRVTPQVTATRSPPHSLLPGPWVSLFSGYQARAACMKHDVVSLADLSHANNSLFLTHYPSKTGKETFPSSFSQLSIKYVLLLLLFS